MVGIDYADRWGKRVDTIISSRVYYMTSIKETTFFKAKYYKLINITNNRLISTKLSETLFSEISKQFEK